MAQVIKTLCCRDEDSLCCIFMIAYNLVTARVRATVIVLRIHAWIFRFQLQESCYDSPMWCLCTRTMNNEAWASYQIRKIAGCACAGNAGNVSPRRRFQRKPLVGDPGMHHGTCVTHVPWCMSGSLTCGDGENVPGIPGACAPATLRIWQEAHEQKLEVWLCIIAAIKSFTEQSYTLQELEM